MYPLDNANSIYKTLFVTDMEQLPTLTELMNFGRDNVDIIEQIGDKYHTFGVKLLDDKTGSRMRALERQLHNNPEDINNEILIRWINGEGREPRNWATLVVVLQECKLATLSDKIISEKGGRGKYVALAK